MTKPTTKAKAPAPSPAAEELLPNKRPARVKGSVVACEHCSRPFYRFLCEPGHRFCSQACGYEARRKYPKMVKKCKQCEKEFEYSEKPFSNSAGNFCSLPFRNKFYESLKGPLSHSYRGITKADKRERFTKQNERWKAAVLARDNHTCQRCGQKDVLVCAHHKKPFATHKELRLDVSNGETLCQPCHWITHGKTFRVDLVKENAE